MFDVNSVHKARKQLSETEYLYWIRHDLFSFNWWFMLILTVLLWGVWCKLVDKKRIVHIFLYGLFTALFSNLLDTFGSNLLLWEYTSRLLYFSFPDLIAVDIAVIPVIFMLIYQYFPNWKSFVVIQIIGGCLFAFVAEPFFSWLGIYKLYAWKYWYSAILYPLFGISSRLFVEFIIHKQTKEADS
ncbi:hypothetical protein LSG31_13095 [Fodinisporobacter ferrooxydans]|uniref:ABC transporter permease n=1 Tax=Fodinisporobacter ferrooxydans TaxID=2901836 RepID=A0ABY4CHK6_9BACL|nr:hypothetical protein LSG31_13095 [Alicyclobacillaceae bacterium MYW30-H2]